MVEWKGGRVMKRLILSGVAAFVLGACGDGPDHEGARQTVSESNSPHDEPSEQGAALEYALDAHLRINQIQLKGTHNSYHIAPTNNSWPEFQYTMPPLTAQLDEYGVRAFELDLHYYQGEFYVYHLPVDDQESTCPRLRDCLSEIRRWSEANPGHHLLQVYFDFRDDYDKYKLIDYMDELDAVILDEYTRERILTPDDLIGGAPDLQTAIAERGWPTLGETRGRTMFVLWNFGDAAYRYAHDGAGLDERVMFVAATSMGWRHAMILGMDTAWEQSEQITEAVLAGYLVRTRSDRLPGSGGDFEAMRDAAFASGAQSVLTDYPAEGMREGYRMDLPTGMPSRCNPVTAPSECRSQYVEHPGLLAITP